MLFVWEPDGKLAGMALAIPCPSQVDEGLERFSADYWHDIRVELRQRMGCHLQILPICALAGDQSPHFLLYGKQEEAMRRRRGVTERQEIAQRVGDAVERALQCTRPDPESDWPIIHRVREITLTPWQITKAERARQGGGYGAMPAISSVGPEGGRELVAATLALIGELWQGPKAAERQV